METPALKLSYIKTPGFSWSPVHFSTAECSNIYCQNCYFRDPRTKIFVGGASLQPPRGKYLPISCIRYWNGYNYMYQSSFSKSWFLLLSADHMHHIILSLTHKYYLSKQEHLVDLTMQSQPTLFFLMLKDLFLHQKLPITLGVKQKLGTNLNLYIKLTQQQYLAVLPYSSVLQVLFSTLRTSCTVLYYYTLHCSVR